MYIICFISLYYLNYIINIKEINGFVVAKCAVCAQFTRSLPVKKIRHRLTRRVAKCPHLRANCANCKQTAPTTSHLGH